MRIQTLYFQVVCMYLYKIYLKKLILYESNNMYSLSTFSKFKIKNQVAYHCNTTFEYIMSGVKYYFYRACYLRV